MISVCAGPSNQRLDSDDLEREADPKWPSAASRIDVLARARRELASLDPCFCQPRETHGGSVANTWPRMASSAVSASSNGGRLGTTFASRTFHESR